MKTVIIKAEVDDDFEPGCCFECPFTYLGDTLETICTMGWSYNDCRIEEEK